MISFTAVASDRCTSPCVSRLRRLHSRLNAPDMARLRLRHLLLLSAALASARSHGSIFDAVAADSMQKLKAALEADPSALDVTGPGGQSPLMHAVLTGKAKAVKYLLKRGADVTVPEKAPRRRTLHRADGDTH